MFMCSFWTHLRIAFEEISSEIRGMIETEQMPRDIGDLIHRRYGQLCKELAFLMFRFPYHRQEQKAGRGCLKPI